MLRYAQQLARIVTAASGLVCVPGGRLVAGDNDQRAGGEKPPAPNTPCTNPKTATNS
jgi:hypothetical protein